MTTLPELLNTDQAANYLGLSVDTLQGWRCRDPKRAGGPPFIKLNEITVRYRRCALEAWLDSRTVTPCN
jgi:predicted DNA-binding transcriptional regulator AlpA